MVKLIEKHKILLIILGILLIVCMIATTGLILCQNSLHVEKVQVVSYEEKFKPTAYATLLKKDLTKKIKYKSNIQDQKIGEYKITYFLKIGFLQVKKSGKVIIKDNQKPTLTLKGEKEVFVCPNQEYEEEGYEAIDNYDGDITEKVTIEKEKDRIVYIAIDSSKNKVTKTRTITYEDVEKPTLSLKGEEYMTIYQHTSFTDPGYQANDNCDGDIQSKVKVSGSVDTSKTGSYTLTYLVKDEKGNETSKTRVVKVIAKNIAGAVIYLTFDDGPSRTITPKVLDILKEEGVQATFFVINHEDFLNQYIKRAYEEGHTIALHSYTHNYQKIYASVDAYFDDLTKIQKKVESITGEKQTIIRFPGGSSNTVSRFNPKIMTTLAREVQKRGFTYFDWNVSSGDAGGSTTKEQVFNSVIGGLKSGNNIVLMHDFEGNYKTLNALRDIIQYCKKNGYKFAKITTSTMPTHHGINN